MLLREAKCCRHARPVVLKTIERWTAARTASHSVSSRFGRSAHLNQGPLYPALCADSGMDLSKWVHRRTTESQVLHSDADGRNNCRRTESWERMRRLLTACGGRKVVR